MITSLKNGLSLFVLFFFQLSYGSESANYLSHPQAQAFIDDAIQQNILPRSEIENLLRSAQRQESILEAIARPAEKTKAWHEYRAIFLTEDRIERGAAFYQQHQASLVRAEQELGVSRFIILAILGVETRYGHFKGRYRVADALATLAFDYPPRSKFFRSEFLHFLHLQKEAGINLQQAKGSYAGAMGFGQFISSSYRHYAIDFNQDGRRDLMNDPVDAIGSVANYFKQHGWRTDQPVVSLARLMETAEANAIKNQVNQGLKPNRTILDLKQAGLLVDADYDDTEKATAWALQGDEGIEYWVGLHNFYVITRYNHSHLYAMAVYQLSKALQQRVTQ